MLTVNLNLTVRPFKRRALAVLLFFVSLLGSCQSSKSLWTYQELQNGKTARVFYSPEDPFSGIEPEFMRGAFEERLHLNIFAGKLEAENKEIIVLIKKGDEVHQALGKVLSGGQRILISNDDRKYIRSALAKKEEITLSIPGTRYQATLLPDNFLQAFDGHSIKKWLPNTKVI